MIREQIINDLAELLKPLAKNTEVFKQLVFERKDLPLIIIKDGEDNIKSDAFSTISHTLEITIKLITANYQENNKLISQVLTALKGFKSRFLLAELREINRQDYEIYEDEYILSQIVFNVIYKTNTWEA